MQTQEIYSRTSTARTASLNKSENRESASWTGRVVSNPCRKLVNAISSIFSTVSNNLLCSKSTRKLYETLQELPLPNDIKDIIIHYNGLVDELMHFIRNNKKIPKDLLRYAERIDQLDLQFDELENLHIVKLLDCCKNLESLSIIHHPKGISVLEKISTIELKHLSISGLREEYELSLLTSNEKLQSLNIKFCNSLSDNGMSSITRCQDIYSFKLEWTNLTDQGLEMLTELTKLRHLELINNQKITDEGLNFVGMLRTLKHLTISTKQLDRRSLYISEKGIQNLGNLLELEYLDIDFCNGKDGSFLELLYPLKNLKTLIVYSSYISGKDIENIKNEIPNLNVTLI